MTEPTKGKGSGLIGFLLILAVVGFAAVVLTNTGGAQKSLFDWIGGIVSQFAPAKTQPSEEGDAGTTPVSFLMRASHTGPADADGDGCISVAEDEDYIRADPAGVLAYVGVGPVNEADKDVVVYMYTGPEPNPFIPPNRNEPIRRGELIASSIDENGCVNPSADLGVVTVRP